MHAERPIRPPNPFATCFTRPGVLPYRAAVGGGHPGDGFVRSLAETVLRHGAAAICGPHGSGKSTLVAALLPLLRQHTAGVAHHTLRSDASLWPSLKRLLQTPRGWLLVIDGFEQLPMPIAAASAVLLRLRRVRLLVTCHRATWWPPVVCHTSNDRTTARALTESLLAGWPEYHGRIMDRFDHHWRRSHGNLRELWFGLYDDFEALLSAADKPHTLSRDAVCRFD